MDRLSPVPRPLRRRGAVRTRIAVPLGLTANVTDQPISRVHCILYDARGLLREQLDLADRRIRQAMTRLPPEPPAIFASIRARGACVIGEPCRSRSRRPRFPDLQPQQLAPRHRPRGDTSRSQSLQRPDDLRIRRCRHNRISRSMDEGEHSRRRPHQPPPVKRISTSISACPPRHPLEPGCLPPSVPSCHHGRRQLSRPDIRSTVPRSPHRPRGQRASRPTCFRPARHNRRRAGRQPSQDQTSARG